jgi:sulfofructose kinase
MSSLAAEAGLILCTGIATHDFIFGVDQMPSQASKYRARQFASHGGGSAANYATTIARLGGRVALVSRLGDDPIGDTIVADLTREGVDCRLMKRFAGRTSSLSAIIVDPAGVGMIINYLDYDLPEDASWLPDLPADTRAVMADSRWPQGNLVLLQRARARGIPAILDGDLPGVSPEAIKAATMVAFSSEGLAASTSEPDCEAGLRKAAQGSDAVMIVTQGGQGVSWLDPAGRFCHRPAYRVEAVDTLGAGDVFHGALALAVAEGQSLEEALRFSSAAAAIKVSRFGGRAGAPNRSELDAFMRAHADDLI